MIMVIERILPDELTSRGIENAASVCVQLTAALKDVEASGVGFQSPDAIFNRLVRR